MLKIYILILGIYLTGYGVSSVWAGDMWTALVCLVVGPLSIGYSLSE
jgi:hypothetical protein